MDSQNNNTVSKGAAIAVISVLGVIILGIVVFIFYMLFGGNFTGSNRHDDTSIASVSSNLPNNDPAQLILGMWIPNINQFHDRGLFIGFDMFRWFRFDIDNNGEQWVRWITPVSDFESRDSQGETMTMDGMFLVDGTWHIDGDRLRMDFTFVTFAPDFMLHRTMHELLERDVFSDSIFVITTNHIPDDFLLTEYIFTVTQDTLSLTDIETNDVMIFDRVSQTNDDSFDDSSNNDINYQILGLWRSDTFSYEFSINERTGENSVFVHFGSMDLVRGWSGTWSINGNILRLHLTRNHNLNLDGVNNIQDEHLEYVFQIENDTLTMIDSDSETRLYFRDTE